MGKHLTENRILCLWAWKLQISSLVLDKYREGIVVVLSHQVLDNGDPKINPTQRYGTHRDTHNKAASRNTSSYFPKGLVCRGHL